MGQALGGVAGVRPAAPLGMAADGHSSPPGRVRRAPLPQQPAVRVPGRRRGLGPEEGPTLRHDPLQKIASPAGRPAPGLPADSFATWLKGAAPVSRLLSGDRGDEYIREPCSQG